MRLTRLAAALAGALLAGVILVLGAGSAAGHAGLTSSTPADGEVLALAPRDVRLTFGETVETRAGWVRLYGAGGPVDVGRPEHPGGAERVVAIRLPAGLQPGSYLVSWQVTSLDGHASAGTFGFSVGAPGPAPRIADRGGSLAVGLLLPVARFLAFAAIGVLVGTTAVVLLCWPSGWQAPAAITLIWSALSATGLTTLAVLALQGAQGSGRGLDGVLDRAVWQALPDTRPGVASGVRLLSLLAVAAVLRLGVSEDGAVPALAVRLLLAGSLTTLLVGVAMGGHAANGPAPELAMAVDVAHLAAFSIWLGGLPVLATVLLRSPDPVPVTRAVARFSQVAATCIGTLILTGTLQAWRQLAAPEAVVASTYGRLVLAKAVLLTAVVVLAVPSRRWVRRRVGVVAGQSAGPDATADAAAAADRVAPVAVLRRRIGLELLAGSAVLAIAAVLVATPPGRLT